MQKGDNGGCSNGLKQNCEEGENEQTEDMLLATYLASLLFHS